METSTDFRRVEAALKHSSGFIPQPFYEFGYKLREARQKYEGPYTVHCGQYVVPHICGFSFLWSITSQN